MTIEEISKAKREAEARIRAALSELMVSTGTHVDSVRIEYVDISRMSGPNDRVVGEVRIDLRVS